MMGSGMMGFGLIWVFVLLVALVVLVVWLVRIMFPQAGNDQDTQKSAEDSALEVARQRYARGEITAEEFAWLKQDLT